MCFGLIQQGCDFAGVHPCMGKVEVPWLGVVQGEVLKVQLTLPCCRTGRRPLASRQRWSIGGAWHCDYYGCHWSGGSPVKERRKKLEKRLASPPPLHPFCSKMECVRMLGVRQGVARGGAIMLGAGRHGAILLQGYRERGWNKLEEKSGGLVFFFCCIHYHSTRSLPNFLFWPFHDCLSPTPPPWR